MKSKLYKTDHCRIAKGACATYRAILHQPAKLSMWLCIMTMFSDVKLKLRVEAQGYWHDLDPHAHHNTDTSQTSRLL